MNKGPSKSAKDHIQKKVVIVHGWDGDVNKDWFPWLKDTLEDKGFNVVLRQLPNPQKPSIDEWVNALREHSGEIDNHTYFIGHSIGCQTILRMLENHEADKIGGAIFVAGWFDLKEDTYKRPPETEAQKREIAKPWIQNQIDFEKLQDKFHPGKVVSIFSDNDPYVDISNAKIFKDKLGARVLMESGKGHYDEDSNVDSIPIIVEELIRISTENHDENN